MNPMPIVDLQNWKRAARAQLRFIPAAPRRGMLVFLILGLLLVLTRSCSISLNLPNQKLAISGLAGVYPLFLIGAALWAMSIWYREGPSQRDYHWTLPVDRRIHDILRVFSGAAWLLVFLAVPVLVGMVMHYISAPSDQTGGIPAWIWVAHLTGPLTLYLLCSTASLRSDHPGLWVFGAPIALVTVWGVLSFWDFPVIPDLIWTVLLGRMGLLKVLGLPLLTEIELSLQGYIDSGLMIATGLSAAFLWVFLGALAVLASGYRYRQS